MPAKDQGKEGVDARKPAKEYNGEVPH